MSNISTRATVPTLPADTRLKVVNRNPDKLKPYEGNARTHSDKQIAQIAASIKTFGFVNPVLLSGDGTQIKPTNWPRCIAQTPAARRRGDRT